MEFEWHESQTRFAELCCGDVFYVEDDRRLVFMKVDEVSNEFETYNAVDFSDATLTYFSPGDPVNKVKAKMVLS